MTADASPRLAHVRAVLFDLDGTLIDSAPDLGAAAEVMTVAFALPQGAVSDPIATANGTAIVKVLEKQQTTDADLTSSKDEFRDELLTDRRNRFFSAYMVKAKLKMKIQVNRDAIQKVIG